MATNYDKYIHGKQHLVSNCGQDERGRYHGGAAGDQSGREYYLREWYNKGWTCVLRYPEPVARMLMCHMAIDAALNPKIGYDQDNRKSFWDELKANKFDPALITKKCEADCTSSTTAIAKGVGYLKELHPLAELSMNTTSRTMRINFIHADFIVFTDSKYLTSPKYLLPGDVLLKENHHACINVSKGVLSPSLEGEKKVIITGRNVWVREGPAISYETLAVVHYGDTFPYLNERYADGSGWYKVNFQGHEGFVSCKYSKLI